MALNNAPNALASMKLPGAVQRRSNRAAQGCGGVDIGTAGGNRKTKYLADGEIDLAGTEKRCRKQDSNL